MSRRLSIGEFSKLCRLTIVALRHYERVGLLMPAEIDPGTGYRYYHFDQIDIALQIGLLRSLDVSIAELRSFVAGSARLADVLATQRMHLKAQMHDRQRMVDVIDALAAGAGATPYEIVMGIEPGSEVIGFSVATSWTRVERATQHGLARLAVLLRRAGVDPDSTRFGALFPVVPSEQVTVTVFADLHGVDDVGPPLAPVTLASADAMSTIHRGDHRLLGYAYRALLGRVAAGDLEATGLAREHYLSEGGDDAACTRLVIPTRARRRG